MKKMFNCVLKNIRIFSNEKHYQSYSQSGEDLIVNFIFQNLLFINNPTFIDVGANHPINFNNTFFFYKNGSKGINIDPNEQSYKLLKKYRINDINIKSGVGKEKAIRKLYKFNNSMLNTFDTEEARLNGQIIFSEDVKIITLNDIVQDYSDSKFPDFLSLDTEGMDLEILESINYEDIDNSVPKVICVESVRKIEENRYQKDFAVIDFLKDKGYVHHSDTFINSILVHPYFLRVKLI